MATTSDVRTRTRKPTTATVLRGAFRRGRAKRIGLAALTALLLGLGWSELAMERGVFARLGWRGQRADASSDSRRLRVPNPTDPVVLSALPTLSTRAVVAEPEPPRLPPPQPAGGVAALEAALRRLGRVDGPLPPDKDAKLAPLQAGLRFEGTLASVVVDLDGERPVALAHDVHAEVQSSWTSHDLGSRSRDRPEPGKINRLSLGRRADIRGFYAEPRGFGNWRERLAAVEGEQTTVVLLDASRDVIAAQRRAGLLARGASAWPPAAAGPSKHFAPGSESTLHPRLLVPSDLELGGTIDVPRAVLMWWLFPLDGAAGPGPSRDDGGAARALYALMPNQRWRTRLPGYARRGFEARVTWLDVTAYHGRRVDVLRLDTWANLEPAYEIVREVVTAMHGSGEADWTDESFVVQEYNVTLEGSGLAFVDRETHEVLRVGFFGSCSVRVFASGLPTEASQRAGVFSLSASGNLLTGLTTDERDEGPFFSRSLGREEAPEEWAGTLTPDSYRMPWERSP